MNWLLFAVGAAGALGTIYLSTKEVIPEFRPLYDTTDIKDELLVLRDKIKKAIEEIDTAQAKLQTKITADELKIQQAYIESSQTKLKGYRDRQKDIEGKLTIGQIWSRGLGFVVYVFLGGIISSLLAGWVTIAGVIGNLPQVVAALIVGSSWISYLNTLSIKTKTDASAGIVQNSQQNTNQTIADLIKQVQDIIKKLPTQNIQQPKMDKGVNAPELPVTDTLNQFAEEMKKAFDNAQQDLQRNYDSTNQKVKENMQRIL